MPKNEGAKTPNTSRGTKIEPRRDIPATYPELNINKKDASKWQKMAENKKGILEKIEEYKEQEKSNIRCYV